MGWMLMQGSYHIYGLDIQAGYHIFQRLPDGQAIVKTVSAVSAPAYIYVAPNN
jgi:hypothetical protein